MSKSNISILAKSISSKRGLSQADAERFISKMFEIANEGLQEDKLLKMKWLGTFKVTAIKDRESVDVNTGERIVIEGRDKITFTPDNILKEIVNKPFAQFETVVVNDGVDFSDIDEKFAHQPEEVEEDVSTLMVSQEVYKSNDEQKEEVTSVNPSMETPANEEVPVNEADSVSEDNLEIKDAIVNEKPSVEVTATNVGNDVGKPTENLEVAESPTLNVVEPSGSHHFMIPKYMVAIVCFAFVILLGGIGWFAFNYGKMQAQRDQLALQLQAMQKPTLDKEHISVQSHTEDSTVLALKKKAQEDSIRMAATSNAVEMVEKTEPVRVAEQSSQSMASEQPAQSNASAYDADPRVRTGAYRIVGVAQTVVVKAGQTITSLSSQYLGPGMECYVEAVNGTAEVKVGQKIKIPKLELKRKNK